MLNDDQTDFDLILVEHVGFKLLTKIQSSYSNGTHIHKLFKISDLIMLYNPFGVPSKLDGFLMDFLNLLYSVVIPFEPGGFTLIAIRGQSYENGNK